MLGTRQAAKIRRLAKITGKMNCFKYACGYLKVEGERYTCENIRHPGVIGVTGTEWTDYCEDYKE